MSWFKKCNAPPKVTILSYGGGAISVLIDTTEYLYRYISEKTPKTIEFYISRGWHGKALQQLNKLEIIGKREVSEDQMQ